jgi:hypothetical protein
MREPLPLATLVHATPARMRLRVASRRGDAAFFEACAARLAELPGIAAVDARAMTASLLLHHEDVSVEALAEAAERAGLFIVAALDEAAPAGPALPPPPALGAVAFGALGVMQLFNKRVFPPALTLFWYAATLAKVLEPKDRGR